MPDEDVANRTNALIDAAKQVSDGAKQVSSMAERVANAGTTFLNAQASVVELTATVKAMTDSHASRMDKFQETVRVEIMARLDRLQDEQTKQRMDMEVLLGLLGDSLPAALLARIRQLEDEIRRLKGEDQ